MRSIKSRGRKSDSAAMLADIDLNLLTAFDAVMTERHVTRAAERLGLTQSAVSNSLGRLRVLIGDQLFVKAPKGVVPTLKAIELWPVIHHSLHEMAQAVYPDAFNASTSLRAFSISTGDLFISLCLPRLLEAFSREAPLASLKIVPHDEESTSARLVRGEADLELSTNLPRQAAFESMPMWSEDFVVIARKQHTAMSRPLSIETLCKLQHVVVNLLGSAEFFMDFDDTLSAHGLVRDIKLSVNQFTVACDALIRSDLVGVFPRSLMLLPLSNSLSFRAVPIPLPQVRTHVVWHRRNNLLASHHWFRNVLFQIISQLRDRLTTLTPTKEVKTR